VEDLVVEVVCQVKVITVDKVRLVLVDVVVEVVAAQELVAVLD
jgi:hypothetical protein